MAHSLVELLNSRHIIQVAQLDKLMPHLDGLAGIQVFTLVGAVQHVGQHDSLHVCSGQLQQVVETFVPGLKGAQLASVLAQPHCHRVQQPCCAIPAQCHAFQHIRAVEG